MSKQQFFFKKNKKYVVVQTFNFSNYIFEAGEELTFKTCQFAPYDEVWCYSFKNKSGEVKYLNFCDKTELNSYTKYFLEK